MSLYGSKRANQGARIAAMVGIVATQSLPTTAQAYGTIGILGQHNEHQKITRLALADEGFGPITMDRLAGTKWKFGAVGAADVPWHGLVYVQSAHCDNGDYLAVPGYKDRKQLATDALSACRANIKAHLKLAIHYAGSIKTTTPEDLKCNFNPKADTSGKCRVLLELGLALHTVQDFYAHSNWVDPVRTSEGTIADPPGLGNIGISTWLSPEDTSAVPDGLISGCWQGVITVLHCKGRVTHGTLNKDTGEIELSGTPVEIGSGTTPRGAGATFRASVIAASDDTRFKWEYFKAQVLKDYGEKRGQEILCLIVNDAPAPCSVA